MKLRVLLTAIVSSFLAACGGGGGGISGVGGGASCSIDDQKADILALMQANYLYNDLLPSDVNIDDFATPEALLESLTSVQPLDRFSFIADAAADAALFNEGEFVGFGFSTTVLDPATDDVRFVRVFGGGPADDGGIERGQRLLSVDGVDVGTLLDTTGLSEAFGPSDPGVTRTLRVRNLDGSEFDAVLTKRVVTIDPVPQVRTYTIGTTTYGYIEFWTFIATANDQLAQAFVDFGNAGITDIIVDLRYNGGGRVDTAEFFGDLLGGLVATGRIFSQTLFNQSRELDNRTELFEQRSQSLNLSSVVFITTGGTASASELVINGLEPEVNVQLVGSTTFGKPVGQEGFRYCDTTKLLRPTTFETVNGLGNGDYFDGLPVDCEAEDDVTVPVGIQGDPSLDAALTLISTGACPVVGGLDANKAAQPIAPFRPPAARTSAEAYVYAY